MEYNRMSVLEAAVKAAAEIVGPYYAGSEEPVQQAAARVFGLNKRDWVETNPAIGTNNKKGIAVLVYRENERWEDGQIYPSETYFVW